jgi:hypothetical protein
MENYQAELEARVQSRYDRSINLTFHAHIDIAGDLVAGTLLSQILYWFGTAEDGRLRVRIERDGELWLVKSREDWFNEIRISPKQFDRAIKELEKKKLIIRKNLKFKGSPTTHIRPNYSVYNEKIKEWRNEIKQEIIQSESERFKQNCSPEPAPSLEFPQRVKSNLPKGKNGTSPKGKMELPQKGISTIQRLHTKINNTEITSIDYLQQQPEKNVVVEKTPKTSDNVVHLNNKENARQENDYTKKELIQICKTWASQESCFGEPASELSDKFWNTFIRETEKNGIDTIQAITDTYCAFKDKLDTIRSLQAVLVDGARGRWESEIKILAEDILHIKAECLKPKKNFTFYNWLQQ